MGCVSNITATSFPKQGEQLHGRFRVIFHYGGPEIQATCVRDDMEDPYKTIFRLDDGRYVLASECQYSMLKGTPA